MADNRQPLSAILQTNPAITQDWLVTAWMMPLQMTVTLWDNWAMLSRTVCRTVFHPTSGPTHEDHAQLKMPDPISGEGEHDLFA